MNVGFINRIKALKYISSFHGYSPQPVTYGSYVKWLSQFEKQDQDLLVELLSLIQYFSEKETKDILVKLNSHLVEKLKKDGLVEKQIIYITISEPASSSHTMMRLLRDGAGLERKSEIIDCHDFTRLTEKLLSLMGSGSPGAVVYVDDFAQTGNQFIEERSKLHNAVPLLALYGEYLLTPCLCEEAFARIKMEQVDIYKKKIHDIDQRPLHERNTSYSLLKKERLTEICRKIDRKAPLGYGQIASMIVYFNNTPNGTPVFVRGDVGQRKFAGLLPSSKDLIR